MRTSTYDLIGGAETIRRLVEAFYPKVLKDPVIGPLFPEDIEPVIEKQFLFLTQFFGGPDLYTQQNGHPMMRARHMPFPITEKHAQAWLGCMQQALQELELSSEVQTHVLERLSGPAYHFINTSEQE